MNPDDFVKLVSEHKWVALAALIIYTIVRLLKSDTKIPITIPPRVRAPLAIALGGAAGALDKLADTANVTWTEALLQGSLAAFGAIVLHTLAIDSVRAGKELPIPGLIIPGAVPAPGKPVTLTPPAMPPEPPASVGAILIVLGGLLVATQMNACALFNSKNLPTTTLVAEQIACILEHAFVDDATLDSICNIVGAEQQAEAKKVQQKQQAVLKTEAQRAKAEACMPDGGK